MMKKRVDEAFSDFVIWRSYIIKALISDGKFFHKTIYVETARHKVTYVGSIELWEVELDDELLALLPPSTMPLNLFSGFDIEWDWLLKFTEYCEAWLKSIALNSYGLSKEGRTLLFKEINNLRSIPDVCATVAHMKVEASKSEVDDEDEESYEDDVLCYACRDDASCVFWTWCDTCKEDTFQGYCNSCSECPDKKCKSCSEDFAMFVRRSDSFNGHNLKWPF